MAGACIYTQPVIHVLPTTKTLLLCYTTGRHFKLYCLRDSPVVFSGINNNNSKNGAKRPYILAYGQRERHGKILHILHILMEENPLNYQPDHLHSTSMVCYDNNYCYYYHVKMLYNNISS